MEELEKKLGYTFRDPELLRAALYHSSYANEHRSEGIRSNERLEFLGDAVLGFVSAEHLFKKHPELPEGDLTRIRAALVRSGESTSPGPPYWPTPPSPCLPPCIWTAGWTPPATSSIASCWTRNARRWWRSAAGTTRRSCRSWSSAEAVRCCTMS